MSEDNTIVIFDGTFDGLLTIVYKHYYGGLRPFSIVADGNFQQFLDAEYLHMETEFENSAKVMAALRKIGKEATENAYAAFLHGDEDRYLKIYYYLLLVFKKKQTAEHYRHLDYVDSVQKMAIEVFNEAHLFKGFCRFAELENKVYYCEIKPKNNVLPIVAEHFIDRMSTQFFVIHDRRRGIAAIYDTKTLVLTQVPESAALKLSEAEDGYRAMWKDFVKNIAVEGRVSKKRQDGMLPKRYREYMTEFMNS